MKNLRKGRKLTAIILTLMLLAIASACTGNNDNDSNGNVEASVGENNVNGNDSSGNAESSVDENNVNWDLYNERAKGFVTAAASGDFNKAAGMFDEEMATGLGASGLQSVWESIIAQAGNFVSIDEIENTVAQGYYVCFITSWHEKSGITLQLTFSEDGLVAGLFVMGFPALPDSMKNTTP